MEKQRFSAMLWKGIATERIRINNDEAFSFLLDVILAQ